MEKILIKSREYGDEDAKWITEYSVEGWERAAKLFIEMVNTEMIDTENCEWKAEKA